MSGSASWMRRRTSARVSPRQSPRDWIRSSMRREAAFSFARGAAGSGDPRRARAPAFGGDLDLVADLRGLLARDVPLAFGLAMLSIIIRPFLLDVSLVALGVHPRTAHSTPSSPIRAEAALGRGDGGVLDRAAARSRGRHRAGRGGAARRPAHLEM